MFKKNDVDRALWIENHPCKYRRCIDGYIECKVFVLFSGGVWQRIPSHWMFGNPNAVGFEQCYKCKIHNLEREE